MRKPDFGLSNPYLKFGAALLLLGIALVAGSFLLGTYGTTLYVGFSLFVSGVVIYVAGRVAKAISSLAK